MTGTIPTALTQLASLTELTLENNQLGGLVPLSVAYYGESVPSLCRFVPGNPGLYMPDIPAYRNADTDLDGLICGLAFASAADIGEDAVDQIEELVPDPLNSGQANALISKIENAMAKAANGQYAAAINQMQAFISQLNDMVASGTLTAQEAAPFVTQAQSLIAIWNQML